jgi:hypothetical protein
MNADRPRVRIVVDEVVLRGLTPAQAAAAVSGLERTLGALASGADPTRLTDRTVPVVRHRLARTPARSAAEIGMQAATAIWTALGGER